VDQDLLRQLNARATDDVDRELFGPDDRGAKPAAPQPPRKTDAPAKPDRPPKPDAAAGDRSERLSRELGPAGEKDDPLVDIARQMHQAEGLLGQAECGPRTQQLQGRIVADLEELLKEARKRCGGSGQRSSPQSAQGGGPQPGGRPKQNPNPSPSKIAAKPGPKPTPQAKGAGPSRADPAQRAALQSRVWGNLPQRERMQMEQKPPEQFLPKYDLLIEEYFRRLAEEKAPGNER